MNTTQRIAPPGRPLRRDRSTRGLTLPELLVVVVIIGILVGIGVPKLFDAIAGARASEGARQLAGDLSRTRMDAIRRNRPLSLTVTGADRYQIDSVGERRLPTNVQFDAVPVNTTVRMASFGPPTSGPATLTVRSGGRTRTVRLFASGRVAVQ